MLDLSTASSALTREINCPDNIFQGAKVPGEVVMVIRPRRSTYLAAWLEIYQEISSTNGDFFTESRLT